MSTVTGSVYQLCLRRITAEPPLSSFCWLSSAGLVSVCECAVCEEDGDTAVASDLGSSSTRLVAVYPPDLPYLEGWPLWLSCPLKQRVLSRDLEAHALPLGTMPPPSLCQTGYLYVFVLVLLGWVDDNSLRVIWGDEMDLTPQRVHVFSVRVPSHLLVLCSCCTAARFSTSRAAKIIIINMIIS